MSREKLEQELIAHPVRSLQYMLKRMGEEYPFLQNLTMDGIFGEQTLEAVMRFQKEFSLPVTGIVDRRTWNEIRDCWMECEEKKAPPRMLRAFPGEQSRIGPGEERDYLILPQAMFQVLGRYLNGIIAHKVDGVHGPESVENVRWLQRAAGRTETGVLDHQTWNVLSRLYEVFVVESLGQARQEYIGGWG